MTFLSVSDPAMLADPVEFYAQIARMPPVFWSEADESFVVWRHADVKSVMADYARFDPRQGSLQRNEIEDGPFDFDPIFLQSPPDHTRLRKLAAAGFSMASVARFERGARDVAEELALGLPLDDGGFDIVGDFAEALVTRALLDFLEVSEEDRAAISATLLRMIRSTEGGTSSSEELSTELSTLIARHTIRAREEGFGGFPGALYAAEIDGDRLSSGEAFGLVILAAIGGAEDMVKALANLVFALHRFPACRDEFLADPEGRAQAVLLEAMRLFPTTQFIRRVAKQPLQLHGVDVPEGASITAMIGPANRDESVFPEAATMRLDRRNISASLTFGSGAHVCVGKHVGRVIVGAGLLALRDRLGSLRLDLADSSRSYNRPILGFARLAAHAPPGGPAAFIPGLGEPGGHLSR